MKAISIGCLVLILFGGLAISYEFLREDPRGVNFGRTGYQSLILGCVTLALVFSAQKGKGIIGLFYSGVFLLALASEQTQALLARATKDHDVPVRLGQHSASYIFIVLGLSCILGSWLILILKQKKE